MSSMQIEFNYEGIGELLHETGRTICAEYAQRIADACGDGYTADVHNAGSRTVASVSTVSEDPDEILRHLT